MFTAAALRACTPCIQLNINDVVNSLPAALLSRRPVTILAWLPLYNRALRWPDVPWPLML